ETFLPPSKLSRRHLMNTTVGNTLFLALLMTSRKSRRSKPFAPANSPEFCAQAAGASSALKINPTATFIIILTVRNRFTFITKSRSDIVTLCLPLLVKSASDLNQRQVSEAGSRQRPTQFEFANAHIIPELSERASFFALTT